MSTSVSTVRVDLGNRTYSISIGSGILDAPESYLGLPPSSACAIVSNTTVAPLFADRLAAALCRIYAKVHVILLPDGEVFKEWTTLQRIFDELLAAKCDRSTTIFALGGGVIGDLAGFAAACYMRGVPYIHVPTTLLAQVDSAVGGKTAINHPRGKNMIGVFNQPTRVIVDVDTLDNLPQRELIAGLAEVIKYGAIVDDEFLVWTDRNLSALIARDKAASIEGVRRSCEIKARIVAEDEREAGRRAILNFGHTFAHAIEAGVGYGGWLHGEAVGCGMLMAADLSARAGLVDRAQVERLARVVREAGLPTRPPPLGVDRFLELMRGDKKAVAGEMKFVLLDGPGSTVVKFVESGMVAATVESFTAGAGPLRQP